MTMYLRALLLLSVLISCNTSAALFDDKDAQQERAAQQEQARLQEMRITSE